MQLDIFYYYLFIFSYYYLTGCDRKKKIIEETSVDSDNVITINFNEDIYSKDNGTGNLEINDFTIYLNNEEITELDNFSVTKKSKRVYLLVLQLSKIPNGTEIIKINPKKNSIYDSAGNAASETQQNNIVTLNKKTKPFIKETIIDSNNTYIEVTFSEKVYSNPEGNGNLELDDFTISIKEGHQNINYTLIKVDNNNNNNYKLYFELSNNYIPNGEEILTINLNKDSVFDSVGNSALEVQHTIFLNKKTSPFIENVLIDPDNTYIEVTFSEEVYSQNNGTGVLDKENFLLISDNSISIKSFENNDKIKYKLYLNTFDIPPSGNEKITVNLKENSVYDAFGNVSLKEQSNNQLFLNKKTQPKITTVEVSSENNYIDVTFSEEVFSKNDGTCILDINDFSLSIDNSNGLSILNHPISINKENNSKFRLFLELFGTPTGIELLTVNPKENSIFDYVGNAASTTQNNNKIKLNKKTKPVITEINLTPNNDFVEVTFNEEVYSNTNSSGNLDLSDFVLSIQEGQIKIQQNKINKLNNKKYELHFKLLENYIANGTEILKIILGEDSIFDLSGNDASSIQNNNTINLNKKTKPTIIETLLSSEENAYSIAVTFSEDVYSNQNGINDTIVKDDFIITIDGGTATINSIYRIESIENNKYMLYFNLKGIPNGNEILTVNPENNSISDFVGNIMEDTQNNNIVFFKEKIPPVITNTIINPNNSESIIVTFNEAVYGNSNTNYLDKNNFLLSISGGNATFGEILNVQQSVDRINYTIDFSLNGIPNGEELLIVELETDSIYDAAGNVASKQQSNNTVFLQAKILPKITNTIILSEEFPYSLKVTFSEKVYSNNNGTGELTINDFTLLSTNGNASVNEVPDSVESSDKINYIIVFTLNDNPNGEELLTVNPKVNSIYGLTGNAASTTQSSNIVNLPDKSPPRIINTTINSNQDQKWIIVTFSKDVYGNHDGNGDLDKEDFVLSVNDPVTSVNISSFNNIDKRNYRIYFDLIVNTNGDEILTINPKENAIFDIDGTSASDIQSNNTVAYFLMGPQNTIIIDIAFHMIQENDSWSEADNKKIQDQLDVLNKDYQTTSQSMLWDPTKPPDQQLEQATYGNKNMRIQFQLKTGPSSGDNKYYSLIHPNSTRPNTGSVNWNWNWINNPYDTILDGSSSAAEAYGVDYNGNSTKTLNAFFSEVNNGLLGFASLPWSRFGTRYWGCWNLTSSMPGVSNSSPYNLGKTMSHEVGHNFGLYHTFGPDTDYNGNNINDTPFHEESNGGSYVDVNGNPYDNNDSLIPDTSNVDVGRDPVYNIMNYTYDDTLYRFTDDQMYRMWVNIYNFMPAIWNSGNKNFKSESILRLNKTQQFLEAKDLHISYKNKDQLFLKSHGGKCGCKHPLFTNPELAKGNTAIYNLLLKEEKICCELKNFKENYK